MAGRKISWALIVLVLVSGLACGAEDFPSRPIRIVVAYAPGGGNDLFARVLGKRLTETLGKTVLEVRGPEIYRTIAPYVERALAGEMTSVEGPGTIDGEVLPLPDRRVRNAVQPATRWASR